MLVFIIIVLPACSPCKRNVAYETYKVKIAHIFEASREMGRDASNIIQILDNRQYSNCQYYMSLPIEERVNYYQFMFTADHDLDQLCVILVTLPTTTPETQSVLRDKISETIKNIEAQKEDPNKNHLEQKAKSPALTMSQLNERKLNTAKIMFGVGTFLNSLQGSLQPSYVANIEVLYPNLAYSMPGLRLAPTIEVGYLYWKKEITFDTLPGQQSTFQQHSSLALAGFGAREYLRLKDDIDCYIGLIGGYSKETDNDFGAGGAYMNLLSGIAFSSFKIKSAFELRYFKYWNVTQKGEQFNPFGNAIVSKKSGTQDGFAFGLLFSPLVW